MRFPANSNFKAAVIDVAKLVDRHGVHPVESTGVAASAAEPGFFNRLPDKLMDCRRATNATAHVLATERKAADCILVMEVAGSRYLPSQLHTKDRIWPTRIAIIKGHTNNNLCETRGPER